MSDFSCYVRIQNRSAGALTLAVAASEGSWQGEIPTLIHPWEFTPWLRLEDPSGPYGSAGNLTAVVEVNGGSLQADFGDPYVDSNYCNISSQGLSDTQSWVFGGAVEDPKACVPGSGEVPGSGHPVYLLFTFADSADPSPV